jgi:5-methylcytosine-specific restriction endonuclease McrA
MIQYSHTLVLTPWDAPHRWAPWERVMVEMMTEKVEVLKEYPEVVYPEKLAVSRLIPGWSGRMPAVVRLLKPVSMFKKGVKFSRINILTRDGFTCQYCGSRKPMKDLNYDHVKPRIQGGKTVWENIVTACYPCNDRKGGRTPEQAGMKLRRIPFVPKTLPMTQPMTSLRVIPDIVRPYLEGSVALLLASG